MKLSSQKRYVIYYTKPIAFEQLQQTVYGLSSASVQIYIRSTMTYKYEWHLIKIQHSCPSRDMHLIVLLPNWRYHSVMSLDIILWHHMTSHHKPWPWSWPWRLTHDCDHRTHSSFYPGKFRVHMSNSFAVRVLTDAQTGPILLPQLFDAGGNKLNSLYHG